MEDQLIVRFNGESSNLEKASKRAGAAMDQFAKKSASASATVLNTGRVIQDLPYAFNNFGSIANNIDPLIDSFRRVSQEAGGFGKGIKALGSSLLGGAGIGLAISTVTSLVTMFQMGMFDAADATDEFRESVEKAKQSAYGEVASMNALIAVARDEGQARNVRLNAINELQKQYPDYLHNLSLETINSNSAKIAIEALTNSIIQKAIAQKYADKIAELSMKKDEAQAKLLAAQNKEREFNTKLVEQSGKRQLAAGMNAASGVVFNIQKTNQFADETKNAASEVDGLSKQIADYTGKINNATAATLNFTTAPKTKKIKEVREEIKQLYNFIKAGPKIAGVQITAPTVAMETIGDLPPIKSPIDARAMEEIRIYNENLKIMDENNKAIADYMGNQMTPIFQNFFMALQTGGVNAFQALGQAIVQMLQQLLAQLAAMAAVSALLSAFGGGSFNSIFMGMAGKTFGVKGLIPTGMATGGIVPSGYPNDTFPARLSSGEAVIPLDRLSGMIQSMGGGGTMRSRIRGRDLVLATARENRAQYRGR